MLEPLNTVISQHFFSATDGGNKEEEVVAVRGGVDGRCEKDVIATCSDGEESSDVNVEQFDDNYNLQRGSINHVIFCSS